MGDGDGEVEVEGAWDLIPEPFFLADSTDL